MRAVSATPAPAQTPVVEGAPTAVTSTGAGLEMTTSRAECLEALNEAQRLNPFVGEPHLVAAQLMLQERRWAAAESSARRGVALLETLGTSWDKRMSWSAWINCALL